MIKLQKLHDFLVGTPFIPEESIQVWMPECETFSLNDHDPDSNIIEDIYKVNIELDNYPFTRMDFRKIKFSLNWWLKVYQGKPAKGKPMFTSAFDIETSSSAFIWIGTELSEVTVIDENGELQTCTEPLIEPMTVLPTDLKIWLKQEGVDAEKLIYG